MFIWIFALLLFGIFALTGFTLGAIRMTGSLLGLLFASFLAGPLGPLFTPLVKLCGATNPFVLWMLGPLVAGIVVVIVFNVIGAVINRKVDVYYKYKAGDLPAGLWKRLDPRLGMCVGILNAAICLILVGWVLYAFSYATYQMTSSGEGGNWEVNLLNSAGTSIQSSGMSKIAGAIDSMPASYYQAADIVGLVYHNDLLEGRLARYPAFLALAETPQFQDISNDKDFAELRQKQPPISQIIAYPKAQAIMDNPALLKQIWGTLAPNLTDLQNFLKTGQSEKYDAEKILGRWNFDLAGALNAVKRAKPTISFPEMQRTKQIMTLIFAKTTFVASPEPEKLAILKNEGKLHPAAKPNLPPTVDNQTFKGTWNGEGTKYDLTLPDKGQIPYEAIVEGDRLTINGDQYPLVFSREY
jgi:hypothetical protein